jgi:xyloglucan-specific exo-beta-1,4-glucanase
MSAIRLLPFALLTCLAAALLAGESYAWRPFDLRGLGFVTGVLVHPSTPHRVWVRTDVGGAYGYDRAQERWRLCGVNVFKNIESLAIDPEQPDSLYIPAEGEVWASADAGATWAATGLLSRSVAMNGNGDRRRAGERLQVDSAGTTTVLWYGSRNHGLWRKVGAAAWAQVTGPPNGTANLGITSVLVDDASAAGQTSARTIYAGIAGNRLWRSQDGGATWAQVAGGPAAGQEPVRLARAADGAVYMTCMSGADDYNLGAGSVWRLQGGTWTAITPTAPGAISFGPLTLDPRDPQRVLVATYNSTPTNWMFRSDDRGATWSEVKSGTPTIPASWYSWHLWGWSGAMAIDPASPDRLFITTGCGVLVTDAHRAATPAWRATMQGLEESVGMHLRSLPAAGGGRLMAAVQDFIGMTIDPAASGPVSIAWKPSTFGIATGVDYCESDPLTVAWVGSSEYYDNGLIPYAGLSRDGGLTWTDLPNANPNKNEQGVLQGNIAIACDDRNSFVWAPMTPAWADYGKGPPGVYHTRNAGATWTQATGLPDRIGPLDQQFFPSEVLISDRVQPGTFYLINSNNGQNVGTCYRSTDYGATWTLRVSNGNFGDANALAPWQWIVKARALPGRAGELWVCYGSSNGAQTLLRSQDGGATWIAVAQLSVASSIGFGAAAPGRSNPTVFVHATIGGARGLWRSDDATALSGSAASATWALVSNATVPHQVSDAVIQLEGDPSIYGRVYLATGGNGIWMGERQAANTAPVIGSVAAAPGALVLP